MEFTKKRNSAGKTQKTYREWYDESGNYRITWRNEFMGVALTEAFYSCVRCVTALGPIWNFCGKMGPYKTFKKAVEAAEKHHRLWEKFFEIVAGPYKGRAERLRVLKARAVHGDVPVMAMIPEWVRETADPGVLGLLNPPARTEEEECQNETTESDDLSDLGEVSETCDSDSPQAIEPKCSSPTIQIPGPAPAVLEEAQPPISKPIKRRRTKQGSDELSKPTAVSAAEPAPEPVKLAKRNTKKTSSSGKRQRAAMTTA